MNNELKNNGEAVDFSNEVPLISETGQIPESPWPVIDRWIPIKAGTDQRSCVGTLATVDSRNIVSSRSMNVKFQGDEILLATHRGSKKWRGNLNEQSASWHAYWPDQRRQLDIRGKLLECPPSLAEEWWNDRPAKMDLVSVLSRQSQTVSYAELEDIRQRAAQESKKGFEHEKLPKPNHFIVLRLIPLEIEFWEGSFDRVHHRYLFERGRGSEWKRSLMFP